MRRAGQGFGRHRHASFQHQVKTLGQIQRAQHRVSGQARDHPRQRAHDAARGAGTRGGSEAYRRENKELRLARDVLTGYLSFLRQFHEGPAHQSLLEQQGLDMLKDS